MSPTLRKVADRVIHERVPPPEVSYPRRRGEGHFASRRFTREEVIALRRRYLAGETCRALAIEFCLHPKNMDSILAGRSYAWAIDESEFAA